MHVAVMLELNHGLYPALEHLQKVLKEKSEDFSSISSFGPTHLPDAVLKTLDQAFAGYSTNRYKY
jgi:fumarate hydratase class II